MAEVTYDGSYGPLKGLDMSAAMQSALHISFEIRGGLLIRQVHHWAALLFVASIGLHMLRIFFTGAFRKPRELNWTIGFVLFILAMAEGFTGYSLPDDLLSGNGLRIIAGMVQGIPFVGSWLEWLVFGGEFPGTAIVGRLYTLHILLLPAAVLAFIALHLVFVVTHKHTQYAGPGRTNDNVIGYPILPVYAAKAGGFFFIVFGVVMLMGAFFTINPIWTYGPYDPSPVSAGHPAGLVHRLRGRRAAPDARLARRSGRRADGVRDPEHHVLAEHPGAGGRPRSVHRGRDGLPVHRGLGDRATSASTTSPTDRATCRAAPPSALPASRSTRSSGRRRART